MEPFISEDVVVISLEVIFATDKAVFVTDGGDRTWLPLSQVSYEEEELLPDTLVAFTMTEWMAEDKGLV